MLLVFIIWENTVGVNERVEGNLNSRNFDVTEQ